MIYANRDLKISTTTTQVMNGVGNDISRLG
jgi:hypothetical protein